MAYAARFVRTRAMKAGVALCALSVLAFMLGQGAAAISASLTAEPTGTTRFVERVTGAQGTVSPPAPAQTSRATQTTFSTGAQQARPQTAQPPRKSKDKHHSPHKKAAGESSHGGSSHEHGANQHGGKDGQHGDGAKQQVQNN